MSYILLFLLGTKLLKPVMYVLVQKGRGKVGLVFGVSGERYSVVFFFFFFFCGWFEFGRFSEIKWEWKRQGNEMPVQIIRDKKQLDNTEYFNCLGNTITIDARCTCEIKYNIAMARAAFNRQKTFRQQIGLKLSKKVVKCYIWSTTLYCPESWSEIPGKFWNVVLEKDGEDNLDWSCKKWSIT